MTEDRTQKDLLTLVLELAREKIAKPEHWTKDALARMPLSAGHNFSGAGLETSPDSPYACCWCAEGAIRWAIANYKRDEPDGYGEYALDDETQLALRKEAYAAFYRGAVKAGVPYAVLYEAMTGPKTPHPCEINDRADTTHEHVIAAFTEAIRELG